MNNQDFDNQGIGSNNLHGNGGNFGGGVSGLGSNRNRLGGSVGGQFTDQGNLQGVGLLMEINQQVAQRTQDSIARVLSDAEGVEFDRIYLIHQVMLHVRMLDTLAVYEQHASPELQQVIDQATQTTESHLQHAMAVMRELESGGQ